MNTVEVIEHDPNWPVQFDSEAQRLTALMGEDLVAVHHIGSTAIPGIVAKPIIDMLLEVREIGRLDDCRASIERLGYEAMGEFGIEGRRYFRKNSEKGIRTHHVHGFQSGSPHIARHLAFRDFLIAHPEEARNYSDLKRRLAREHPSEMDRYIAGKDGFIKATERKAAIWLESR